MNIALPIRSGTDVATPVETDRAVPALCTDPASVETIRPDALAGRSDSL